MLVDPQNEWRHQSISLSPLSDNPSFQPIEITDGDLSELKVLGIFERVL